MCVRNDEMVSKIFGGEEGISSSVSNYAPPIILLVGTMLTLYFVFNQITRPTTPREAALQ
jgi:hypothetical protein